MNTYYSKWMEQEDAWASEINAKRKQRTWIYAAVAFVLCVAGVSGIGFAAAGVEAGISNIKYGVILGVVSTGIFLLVMVCGDYKKRYMKLLKKEVEKEFPTDSLKEEFAMAMLDQNSGSGRCLQFVWQKGAEPYRFCTASKFAVLRGIQPCIAQLDKTERIELDVQDIRITSNVGDYQIRTTSTSYPIFFYYEKASTADRKKQKVDKLISFPSRELRDQAVTMIREKIEQSETAQ